MGRIGGLIALPSLRAAGVSGALHVTRRWSRAAARRVTGCRRALNPRLSPTQLCEAWCWGSLPQRSSPLAAVGCGACRAAPRSDEMTICSRLLFIPAAAAALSPQERREVRAGTSRAGGEYCAFPCPLFRPAGEVSHAPVSPNSRWWGPAGSPQRRRPRRARPRPLRPRGRCSRQRREARGSPAACQSCEGARPGGLEARRCLPGLLPAASLKLPAGAGAPRPSLGALCRGLRAGAAL